LYSEVIEQLTKEVVDKPKLNHETIQQTISNSLRYIDKELGETKRVMEESALQLATFTKEAISQQFEDARKALEDSVHKSGEVNMVVEKYTKGACTKVAEKIKKIERERGLLEIGKGAVDIMLQMNE